jgi:hypothetical protein
VKTLKVFLALVLCVSFAQIAFGAILFQDDFEGEQMGEEPSRWEYDPDAEVTDIAQIIEDPVEGDKCLGNFGGYVVEDSKEWVDYVVEFDWMFSEAGTNESMAFRYQDAGNFYQLSKRTDDQSINIYMYNGEWNLVGTGTFPVQAIVWYRTQLIAVGPNFTVKMKAKGDETPFSDIDPILEVEDNTFARGGFSTAYNGPIDDVIVGESEDDILAVEPSGKIATTWGNLKR